jgi:hypothetical protein
MMNIDNGEGLRITDLEVDARIFGKEWDSCDISRDTGAAGVEGSCRQDL